MRGGNSRKSFIYSYEGLRAIAMFAVLFFHMFPDDIKGGFLGVVILLTMAGYLSMRKIILMNEDNINIRFIDMISKRYSRLYPSLLFFIFSVLLFMYFTMSEYLPSVKYQAITSVLSINNIAQIINNESYFEEIGLLKPFTHLWALSLEVQMYIIFYFLITSLRYKNKKRIQWLIIFAFLVLASFISMNLNYRTEEDITRIYYGTDTRMFSFFAGAFGALMYNSSKRFKGDKMLKNITAFLLILLSVFLLFYLKSDTAMYRYQMLSYTILIVVIIKLLEDEGLIVSRILSSKIFLYFGKRSYAVYLWHFPVIKFVDKLTAYTNLSVLSVCLIDIAISFILAELSFRIFEVGISGLNKKKFVLSQLMILLVIGVFPYNAHGEGIKKLEELNKIEQAVSFDTNVVDDEDITSDEYIIDKKDKDITNNKDLKDNLENKNKNKKKSKSKNKDKGISRIVVVNDEIKKVKKFNMKKRIEEIKKFNKKYPEFSINISDYKKYCKENISLIGDSLSTISYSSLADFLPALNINARGCRKIVESYKVFSLMKKKNLTGKAVVVALGTNGDIEQNNLKKINNEMNGKMILTTIVLPFRRTEQKRNDDIRNFVAKNKAYLADWYKIAKNDRSLFGEDDIHPRWEGSRVYAFIITGQVIKALKNE